MGIRFSTGLGPFRVSVPLTGRRRRRTARRYAPTGPTPYSRTDKIFILGGLGILVAACVGMTIWSLLGH